MINEFLTFLLPSFKIFLPPKQAELYNEKITINNQIEILAELTNNQNFFNKFLKDFKNNEKFRTFIEAYNDYNKAKLGNEAENKILLDNFIPYRASKFTIILRKFLDEIANIFRKILFYISNHPNNGYPYSKRECPLRFEYEGIAYLASRILLILHVIWFNIFFLVRNIILSIAFIFESIYRIFTTQKPEIRQQAIKMILSITFGTLLAIQLLGPNNYIGIIVASIFSFLLSHASHPKEIMLISVISSLVIAFPLALYCIPNFFNYIKLIPPLLSLIFLSNVCTLNANNAYTTKTYRTKNPQINYLLVFLNLGLIATGVYCLVTHTNILNLANLLHLSNFTLIYIVIAAISLIATTTNTIALILESKYQDTESAPTTMNPCFPSTCCFFTTKESANYPQ